MTCCRERQLGVLNTEINAENEGADETIEEDEQEPELPSVSTFLEVGLDLEPPTPLEFDHHGEIIVCHNATRSASMYDGVHTESPKQMSAPTLSVKLDEKLPENTTEKQEDIRSEKEVTLKCIQDIHVNSGWNIKKNKATSRIPILVKTRQPKKPRITESVHNRKVMHSRSHLPVLIKKKVKTPDIAEVVFDKKAINAGSRIPLPKESKAMKPITAKAVQNKMIPNTGSHIPLPINSKVKGSSFSTEAACEKVAGSRIPVRVKSTVKKSSATNVKCNKTATKRSHVPVPVKRTVKNQSFTEAVHKENVTKRSRLPVPIKRSVKTQDVVNERFVHQAKATAETTKRAARKPNNENKRSMRNTKVDKTDKGKKCIAKEITRELSDKIISQRPTVDTKQKRIVNSKIANMSDQNNTKRNAELNKSRADENRKSKCYTNSEQRGRNTKEIKENRSNKRFSGNLKTSKKTIMNKEDTLFSQDGDVGGCMPKLQALTDIKDVLARQMNDMKREIGDLKRQDGEARVAPTPSGVYTPEMFDNDSDRIQVDIWEIKRQIITMKYLDQSTFAKLESRITEIKGANKELEGNLKRIKFTQEHDVKNESGIVAKDTEMPCSDPIIGETHKIPRPPSDKKPRGKFTRKRLLKY